MVQKEFIDVLKLLVKIESISSEKKHEYQNCKVKYFPFLLRKEGYFI